MKVREQTSSGGLMLGPSFQHGCANLDLNKEDFTRSCLSLAIGESSLLTPHGKQIPELHRALERLAVTDPDEAFQRGEVRHRWDSGFIQLIRLDDDRFNVHFCSGPISVFVPIEQVREMSEDLTIVLKHSKLQALWDQLDVTGGPAPEAFE